MKTQDNPEKGNALVIILITIILMAALSFAVLRNNQGGKTFLTDGQAKIEATQLIKYAKSIENAVAKLTLTNGCSENEISFDDSQLTGYNNAGAPSDKSCHVFDPNGGGITYSPPSPQISSLDWEFFGQVRIHGVGTTLFPAPTTTSDRELIALIPGLSETLCKKINEELGHPFTTVPVDSGDIIDGDGQFVGSFISNENITGPANGPCPDTLCGYTSVCFQEAAGSQYYIFYHTLIVR